MPSSKVVFAGLERRAERAAQDALRTTGKFGYDLARGISSGTKTYHDLEAEDHPYARRHAQPRANPAIINKHRGDFYRAWKKTQVRKLSSGRYGLLIWNDSPVAKFFKFGTSKMHKRPVQEFLLKELRPVLLHDFKKALKRRLRLP